MTPYPLFLSALLAGIVAHADSVTTVHQGSSWTKLPYCGGKTRLTCDNVADALASNRCYIEFSRTSCKEANLYTASTFYPYVWTIEGVDLTAQGNKITIDFNRLSGLEEPYFYVFLRGPGNNPYTKLKYQLNQR